MTSACVAFYPFPALDDLVKLPESSRFFTINASKVASKVDAIEGANSISAWLTSVGAGGSKDLHSPAPVPSLYRIWRALREDPGNQKLVLLSSQSLRRLREYLSAAAKNACSGNPCPRTQQKEINRQMYYNENQYHERHPGFGHDFESTQEGKADSSGNFNHTGCHSLYVDHDEVLLRSFHCKIQEDAKLVCFFAAHLLILVGC